MRFFVFFLAFFLASAPAHAGKVQEVVSDSGIKAWLVQEHSLPLIAVRLSFTGSGYAYDEEGEEGRANMVAALLTTGSGDMNEREYNAALESRAIELNTAVNEDTLEVSMQTLRDHRDDAFAYLALAVGKPRFDTDAVERTRRQVLSILKQAEQNPGYLLQRAWAQKAFGDHPYSRPQLGTGPSIGRLDSYDFEDYAERYLTRENMIVSVVGDITPDGLKKLLDEHFKDLPEKYRPDNEVGEVIIPPGGEPTAIEYAIPQTLVAFGLQGLKRSDPDYFAGYVMNHILGGGASLTSQLGLELREKRGLTYSVATNLEPLKHGAVWKGGLATRNEEAGAALDLLRATLKRFAEDGPTDKELADAKQYLTGSFVLNMDSNASIAAFLTNMQYNQLGLDYLEKRNTLVEQVTREAVSDMAKRLIDTDKLTVVMIGKPVLKPKAPDAVSP